MTEKTITIFDTETTGFPSNKGLEAQPHMVQIAAIQFVGERPVRHHSAVINNPGVEVPERVAEIHGITTVFALVNGISLAEAVEPFLGMVSSSSEIIAFNTAFDLKIINTAMQRAFPAEKSIYEQTVERLCVMNSCIDVVKKPGRYSGYGWPKQIEAYKFLFGEEAEFNAHDAMDDVRACSRIYFELLKRGVKILGPVRK